MTTSGSATNIHMAKAVAVSASWDSSSFVVVIFLRPGDSLLREKMTQAVKEGMEKVRKFVIKSTSNDIVGQQRVSNLEMVAVTG